MREIEHDSRFSNLIFSLNSPNSPGCVCFPEFLTESEVLIGNVRFGEFWLFLPSRFSQFHCNGMRKAIKVHKILHINQQNEHTLAISMSKQENLPCTNSTKSGTH